LADQVDDAGRSLHGAAVTAVEQRGPDPDVWGDDALGQRVVTVPELDPGAGQPLLCPVGGVVPVGLLLVGDRAARGGHGGAGEDGAADQDRGDGGGEKTVHDDSPGR
jgi:hypothetical protein